VEKERRNSTSLTNHAWHCARDSTKAVEIVKAIAVAYQIHLDLNLKCDDEFSEMELNKCIQYKTIPQLN
jgi:hypothetical protein